MCWWRRCRWRPCLPCVAAFPAVPLVEVIQKRRRNRAGPEQIHVTRFTVTEGEELRVSANLEIIASEDIEIAGDLMVDRARLAGANAPPSASVALDASDGDHQPAVIRERFQAHFDLVSGHAVDSGADE